MSKNKYRKTALLRRADGDEEELVAVTMDIYDVLKAYGVTCQATGHAIKKLLMPGQRGHKSKQQDLEEAITSIVRAIELENQSTYDTEQPK